MGKLTGIFQFQGTVGQVTVDSKGRVRQKQASRPITSPRTLENNAEFGAAGAAGKLLRDAFRSASQAVRSASLTGRLTALMRSIIGQDAVNDRGLRQVLKANIGQLLGFNFSDTSLSSTFFAPFSAAYGAGASDNKLILSIPDVTPSTDLSIPQGATHFQIVAAGVQANFATGAVEVSDVTPTFTSPQVINSTPTGQATITLDFVGAPGAGVSTVGVLGVNFFQEVNGSLYPLNNGASNALSVVYAG